MYNCQALKPDSSEILCTLPISSGTLLVDLGILQVDSVAGSVSFPWLWNTLLIRTGGSRCWLIQGYSSMAVNTEYVRFFAQHY
jgi:hypothetical protein